MIRWIVLVMCVACGGGLSPEAMRLDAGPECIERVGSSAMLRGGKSLAAAICEPGESLESARCSVIGGAGDMLERTRVDGGVVCGALTSADGARLEAVALCCL